MFTVNEAFEKKATEHKKPLKHTKVYPQSIVKIVDDDKGFQKLNMEKCGDFNLPYTIANGDSIILDFGRHCVGYLNYSLNHINHITDSPIMLKFSFGEFPYELVADPAEYDGDLGTGWLQNETRNIAITPYTGYLERRYSFRYVKIERLDKSIWPFEINITDIFADSVSAVTFDEAHMFDIPDEKLKKIYDMSVKTLAECSQDVYEDGPKRDRRMWIGDLRLEALTDYVVFNNIDLIKRCIYLFAAYRAPKRFVAPCLYQDSPPYVDKWSFQDYSLFFISCIYDYTVNTGDLALADELYEQMYEQYELAKGNIEAGVTGGFIDWCPDLDKQVAVTGVYIYTFKQLKELAQKLGKDASDIDNTIGLVTKKLLSYYSDEKQLFVTSDGQISIHSQIWAILSGALSNEQCIALLDKIKNTEFEYYIHTPYMMHCYIEALYNNGFKDEAIDVIRDFWGQMDDFGFDCCLEVFNPKNHFESPYGAPETNSACHAWSCTPAYWIYKYYN